jgi:GTPase SAR1 family protein
MYYRDCHAAIIVFDVTAARSLEDAQVWIEELKEKGPASAVVALAANKIDLVGNRDVDDEKISEFVRQNDIFLAKTTSAVTGENVTELFSEVTQKLMEGHQMLGSGKTELQPKEEKSGSECC